MPRSKVDDGTALWPQLRNLHPARSSQCYVYLSFDRSSCNGEFIAAFFAS